ncbi:hypothetical protein THAOC_37229 [Thalassiosira oceanica]|uniref:Uncharacterized protein n=1 Tax=Thalassiosira oceanica TaxID=159749 RepID=K0QZ26_THAOC|nr:hypothetical protein THAOC_37229 [Thalassiosira oceanica]|eukprot:EJK44250.1 hypothetical protein THAOC_37229 [Thalassiosira oceanica]
MDPAYMICDSRRFNSNNASWGEIYGDITEEIPPDAPEPLGAPVTILVFVDADHASNVVTRRLHTGVLIFVQNTLIMSYCKRQNTVESATFESELVAMRLARDLVIEIRINYSVSNCACLASRSWVQPTSFATMRASLRIRASLRSQP